MKQRSLVFTLLLIGCLTSVQPTKTLLAEDVLKLIPDKIEGFSQKEDSKSKVIKLGDIQYSIAEKHFKSKKQQTIKILLFDYKEAPIMYTQATKKFTSFTIIESDSLILRPSNVKDCSGWESYNVYRKNSQILLGVCDRFFLSVEGTNVDLESLKRAVQTFKFETFPK